MSSDSYFGQLEPPALLQRPESVHLTLYQALQQTAADRYLEHSSWTTYLDPASHSAAFIRRRARHNSLPSPGASAFLTAPSACFHVSSSLWSIMLRRHLEIPVYDNSTQLRCTQCHAAMDPQGDHAASCCSGYGFTHRHNNVRNTLASHLFRAVGLVARIEVPFLVPGTSLRPADIFVQPPTSPPGAAPSLPVAYNVTVRRPDCSGVLRCATRARLGVLSASADIADTNKLRNHERQLHSAYNLPTSVPFPTLHWQFVPLAFDAFGAFSTRTASVLKEHATRLAYRSVSTPATILHQLRQLVKAVIWSSAAVAILVRIPPFLGVQMMIE